MFLWVVILVDMSNMFGAPLWLSLSFDEINNMSGLQSTRSVICLVCHGGCHCHSWLHSRCCYYWYYHCMLIVIVVLHVFVIVVVVVVVVVVAVALVDVWC